MNAHDSLLENFTSMQEEFSSSNNRSLREVTNILNKSLKKVDTEHLLLCLLKKI